MRLFGFIFPSATRKEFRGKFRRRLFNGQALRDHARRFAIGNHLVMPPARHDRLSKDVFLVNVPAFQNESFHASPPFHSSKPRTGRAVVFSAHALNAKTRERGRAGQLPRLARISSTVSRQSPLCKRICRINNPVKPGNDLTEKKTRRAVFGCLIAACQSKSNARINSSLVVFTRKPHFPRWNFPGSVKEKTRLFPAFF